MASPNKPSPLIVIVALLLALVVGMAAFGIAWAAHEPWPTRLGWAATAFVLTIPITFEILDRLGVTGRPKP
ncbi:hypothetical protein [Embleya sp. NPDC050493]|uniref:hypothetical protein n=1 Tax=Embleya sp. NPDC050493 TaxID=3363989 RepID=UPI003797F0EC